MNYTEMLNRIIDQSGKMLKEIAQECQVLGVNLTNTYLSSLKTSSGKIASDEISRAIAKVCNAKYEEILVVQAYLDKAPESILKFLGYVRQNNDMALGLANNISAGQEIPEGLRELNRIAETPLAEYICEMLSIYDENYDDFKTMLEEQDTEPKCMVIYPEQLQHVKFVSEKELQKLTD